MSAKRPQEIAPVLPGGTFPEYYLTWSYRHSQVMTLIAAGDTPPKPLASVPVKAEGTPRDVPMSVPEGPGGAYSDQRSQTLAYQMSQEMVAIAAGVD